MKNYIKYNENKKEEEDFIIDYLHLNDDLEIKFNFISLPISLFYCYDKKNIFHVMPTFNQINVKYDIELFKKEFGRNNEYVDIEKDMSKILNKFLKKKYVVSAYNSIFPFWEQNDKNLYD
ncbi:hypothetical protein M0Q50_09365 [bacterium]|jgi:hypothetical protein|nr:hypothetical protein [bacterium]